MTGYSVVGRIPRASELRSRPKEALADPVTGSAFRSLRANLEPQLREQQIDLLVVTSPGKGDGKTTVAALFAESLARVDLRVLLVDADLRRPRIAALAGVNGTPGLSTMLRQVTPLEEAVRTGWSDGLTVLPTSPDPEGGDLLATRFAAVVDMARNAFDVIVVDTPPLLTDDARTLLSMAKGVLLVVTAGAKAEDVSEAVLAAEALHAPLLGIVANRLRESRSLYYHTDY
jgi:capsular exopolysaccharide synthesis family protein